MSLDEMPHTEWLKKQEPTQRQIQLLGFHQWMRNKTSLESGTLVEYRKKLHELMEEDATLEIDKDELGTREKTAVNKFEEYLESNKPVKSDKGGSDE